MKKLVDLLIIIWAISFCFFLLFTLYTFYSIEKERYIVHEKATRNTAEEKIIYEKDNLVHPFILEGSIDSSILYYAASYFYSIPQSIRTEFQNSGWKVIITDKDISKEYYNGPIQKRLAGLADCQNKKIYIHGKRKDIRRAMIHEFGHFVDYNTGMNSTNEKFKEIYYSEMNSLKEKWKIDNHATSNEQEYFAESFVQAILYPKILEKNCPRTYDYVDNVLKSF